MTIKRFGSGSRMSDAVVHGNTVYLAGQVGNAGEDLQTQTRTALANVERLLAEAGSDRSKLLQVTIWLADMADFAAMNEIYDAWVDRDNLPTRACGEAKLATPEYLVEVIAVAAL